MAQFCVYKNKNPASRKQYPYLLDIQSDLLSELRTTVVVPLCSPSLAGGMQITQLNPSLDINGECFIAMTQELACIDRQRLGVMVCDLHHYREKIIAAVDFMISGI
ncbi:CcdB family protein [Halomonas sp. EGI 63088]|uniref:Toxin CcdB n=1 Tax=Halomonas flagellata TaxID=2920385 RepID=A0ABS9RVY8_9GAMM|nr:CcdB family protein [Halomonas flagellata]MCH4563994.1 CcdB family protein [Halomonas flagellata]